MAELRGFQVTYDCGDPARVGEFWAEVLGYRTDPPPEGFTTWPEALKAFGVPEQEWTSAYAVVPPEGKDGPRLFFQRVPEAKSAKNRLHLDVRVSDRGQPVADQERAVLAEVERLEALGAERRDWVQDIGKHFMVMADVEGNEFCLT
ncbi:MAG: VOC family protein [Nocardioidaceae bacterium]